MPLPADNLRPQSLVAQTKSLGRKEFVASIDAPLLFVRGDPRQTELQAALELTVEHKRVLAHPNAEPTEIRFFDPRATPLIPRPVGSSPPPARIRELLGGAVFFAVHVQKRADHGEGEDTTVRVGRSASNDIVLCTPGVSKLHAWFQRDNNDVYYLQDGGSGNGTFVNGTRLDNRAVPVREGDELRFGDVWTILFSADNLWDALLPER